MMVLLPPFLDSFLFWGKTSSVLTHTYTLVHVCWHLVSFLVFSSQVCCTVFRAYIEFVIKVFTLSIPLLTS